MGGKRGPRLFAEALSSENRPTCMWKISVDYLGSYPTGSSGLVRAFPSEGTRRGLWETVSFLIAW